jgi:hypothetical protein
LAGGKEGPRKVERRTQSEQVREMGEYKAELLLSQEKHSNFLCTLLVSSAWYIFPVLLSPSCQHAYITQLQNHPTHFYTEEGDSITIREVNTHLQDYTELQPKLSQPEKL